MRYTDYRGSADYPRSPRSLRQMSKAAKLRLGAAAVLSCGVATALALTATANASTPHTRHTPHTPHTMGTATAGMAGTASTPQPTGTAGMAGTASTPQPTGMAGTAVTAGSAGYHFTTLDNASDLTFNQLLGINNNGHIAGYFGSGAAGHPNKGYLLRPPYGPSRYQNINFPGSVQTQVTGLNEEGVQVGFWSTQNNADMTNNNFGFYLAHGRFHSVNFPTGDKASPPVDQLLGVNDHDVAVGFYTNGQGNNRGYEYNIMTHRFSQVLKPGAPGGMAGPSLTAAAINNHGDVAGFYAASGGTTDAFLKISHGRFITLAVPGASMTQAFGVNDRDEVVGAYTVGTGDNAQTHGFTWWPGHGFTTVDDPQGMGSTTVNGVNDSGDLVGFYTDSAGNTDGMLAMPGR